MRPRWRKKTQIIELLVHWRAEIADGQVRVMFLDECHLLWGDVCGYGWSRRNQPVDVEVKSTKERQTYYGALDYLSKSFVVQEYSAGNEDNTIAFVKYLQSRYDASTRLSLIWDGANYHRSTKMQEFLAQTNEERPQDAWKITCVRLAPNAPERSSGRRYLVASQAVYSQVCSHGSDIQISQTSV